MTPNERSPITLRFYSKEQEQGYQQTFYAESLQQIRMVFLLFILLFAIFGLLDQKAAQEYADLFLMIRFVVVIPIFFVILLSSFTHIFQRYMRAILMGAFIISGLGIAGMLVTVPENISYYGGLFMILYSGFFLIKLDFLHASLGAWIVFAGYVIGHLILNGVSGYEFFTMVLFYFFSVIIGMFGSYYLEDFSRRDFIQKETIAADKQEIEYRVSKQFNEITQAQEATLLAFAKLAESRDQYRVDHVERVGQYSRLLAENLDARAEQEMKMSKHRFLDILPTASYLHDIGKIGIPDQILKKPGRLTSEEYEIVKHHTEIGSRYMVEAKEKNPKNQFIQMGLEIVRYHHEHYDGLGYPDGLKGKDIPLAARIVAVVDVYDALRSRQPYKEPVTHEAALKIILLASGTQFDPMVVSALIRVEESIYALNQQVLV